MKKDVWSVRVPPYVKKYYQKKGVSGGQALIEKYHDDRRRELPGLLKELAEAEKKVVQLQQSILQVRGEHTTELTLCNTIFEKFQKHGRDIHNKNAQNKSWVKSQLEKKDIKTIDVNEFFEHYQQEDGNK